MREILFRGKRVYNGAWLAGDLLANKYERPNICPIGDVNCYPVIPETIGQYTGLKDKNGEKIFEGDIVGVNLFGNAYYPWKVVYIDKDAAFEFFRYVAVGIYGGKATGHAKMSEYDKSQIEVIGNIYDNPELLEGEENE